jgi:hypothetical protein
MTKLTYIFPKRFKQDDIEEIKTPSIEDKDNVLDFGLVETWKRPVISERTKLRPYITSIVMGLWVAGTAIGLVRFLMVGDISILIYSPVVLMVPLKAILDFYFKED